MSTTNQYISERLLEMAIEKLVSEKLNGLVRGFVDFTKGMPDAERKTASLIILGIVETATFKFFAKMKTRIESKSV